MGSRTDGELLDAADSDPAAFEAFVIRHHARLHRYAARRLGAEDAEEVVNDVFATAYVKRARFDRERADAAPWLFGIATNLIRRHARRESKALAAYARGGVDPIAPEAGGAGGVDPSLARALAGLRPRYRDVLFLHAVAELSHDEIAQALDVPVGTVKGWLHRARADAQRALARLDDPPIPSRDVAAEGVD